MNILKVDVVEEKLEISVDGEHIDILAAIKAVLNRMEKDGLNKEEAIKYIRGD